MHTPLLLNMYDNLLYVARQRESERICLRCSRLLNSRCAFRARALRSVFNEIASREQANYYFSSDLFFNNSVAIKYLFDPNIDSGDEKKQEQDNFDETTK